MTFIHIHPDSMDPWVGGKRGRGRIEGVDGEVSFLSTSSVALKWMLLLFRGRRIFFFCLKVDKARWGEDRTGKGAFNVNEATGQMGRDVQGKNEAGGRARRFISCPTTTEISSLKVHLCETRRRAPAA